jgi:malate dehydrogenase (oxaloacetate-decarboxylating)(NADP+)
MALEKEGVPHEEALKKIWLVDSKGLLVKDRPEGGISGHKKEFAQDHPPMRHLSDVVKKIKPSVLIGAAAIGGAFTTEIIKDMASFNDRPVIFALSNPTSKAECTAEDAYKHTDVMKVFSLKTKSPTHLKLIASFREKLFLPAVLLSCL